MPSLSLQWSDWIVACMQYLCCRLAKAITSSVVGITVECGHFLINNPMNILQHIKKCFKAESRAKFRDWLFDRHHRWKNRAYWCLPLENRSIDREGKKFPYKTLKMGKLWVWPQKFRTHNNGIPLHRILQPPLNTAITLLSPRYSLLNCPFQSQLQTHASENWAAELVLMTKILAVSQSVYS